jgi:hypothetical protein
MEISEIFETAWAHVCMYGWAISVACIGKIDIQTYIHDISQFIFDVFLMFSSRNVAPAMEIEIPGFRENR